jgi:metal-dependent hydrolase (beta-lactamase superfamily II)
MAQSHGRSGLINTGTVLQSIKEEPVYSIVGGFHLWAGSSFTYALSRNKNDSY